jgi:hypothetical protein
MNERQLALCRLGIAQPGKDQCQAGRVDGGNLTQVEHGISAGRQTGQGISPGLQGHARAIQREGATDFNAITAHELLGAGVLGLQSLDQAIDTVVADFSGKAVAVVGHQADAGNFNIVDLPACIQLL